MKKKHFTGVLVLTAAVALGTVSPVSPVALQNTVVVAKAAEATDFSDKANKLDKVGFEVIGTNKIRIYSKDEANHKLSTMLSDKFTYGFGESKASAFTAAIQENAPRITLKEGEKEAFIELTETSKLHLVILDKTTPDENNKVLGKEKEFHLGIKPDDASLANKDDAEQLTTTVANLEYTEVTGVNGGAFDIDTAVWKEPTKDNANYKIPADDDKVKAGTSREFFVRVKAVSSTATFASPVSNKITITKKQQITLEDLKKLTYTITDDNELEIKGIDEKITNVTTKSGTVQYKIVNKATAETDNLDSGINVTEGIKVTGIDKTKSVVIFVNEDKAQKLILDITQQDKPEVEQVSEKYQLKGKQGKELSENLKYQLKKDNDGYQDITLVNKMIDLPEDGNYKVRVKGANVGKEVKFGVSNKTSVEINSEESDKVGVATINTIISKTEFDKLTFTTVKENDKLVLKLAKVAGNGGVLSAAKTDKLEYGYEGGTMTVLDKAYTKETVTPEAVKAGKFVVRVQGNSSLVKTIKFVSIADKDGKPFAKKYQSPKVIKEAMGTVGNYKIKEKGASTAAAQAKDDVYSKTATYLISYNQPTAEGAVVFENNVSTYKLADEVEVLLQTEADAAKEKNSSSGYSPVVPSTGGGASGGSSTVPKKDEPKKNDTKKEEPKKNESKKDVPKKDEPKKDEPKKDDTTNDDNTTKISAQVAAKNTKKDAVSVSTAKVEEALETGLKVIGKSGEVKFSASTLEKVVGDEAKAVTVTLRTTATRSTAKEVTKKLNKSKLVSNKVFTLDIKVGKTAVKESQLKGSKISVTLKVKLNTKAKTVWVMDLSTGKKVKATYQNGKVKFKTANLGKFVLIKRAK